MSLVNVIQKWMDGICETKTWSNAYGGYVGDYTVEYMADAALIVLMSIKEFQEYAKEEGYFDE